MHATKQALIDALRTFINQRPGFEPGNYSTLSTYRADVRKATQQRADALAMLAYVEARDGITAEAILDAASASGGRLSLNRRTLPWTAVPMAADGTPMPDQGSNQAWQLDYTAGQYWCTEYRAGVCRVLASVIWAYLRDGLTGEVTSDRVRKCAHNVFGRGIASRWFN